VTDPRGRPNQLSQKNAYAMQGCGRIAIAGARPAGAIKVTQLNRFASADRAIRQRPADELAEAAAGAKVEAGAEAGPCGAGGLARAGPPHEYVFVRYRPGEQCARVRELV
jgi:hypothetical protein